MADMVDLGIAIWQAAVVGAITVETQRKGVVTDELTEDVFDSIEQAGHEALMRLLELGDPEDLERLNAMSILVLGDTEGCPLASLIQEGV